MGRLTKDFEKLSCYGTSSREEITVQITGNQIYFLYSTNTSWIGVYPRDGDISVLSNTAISLIYML